MRSWTLAALGALIVSVGFLGGAWSRQRELPVIVVLSGGDPARNPVAGFIAAGARQAASECGVRVEVIGADRNLQDQLVELRSAFDRLPMGICLSGHAGEDGLSSLVNQAIERGIVLTGFAVDMPHLRQRHLQKGFGFIGADPIASGQTLVAAAVERLNFVGGERVLVLGTRMGGGTLQVERMRAVVEGFQAAGQQVVATALPPELAGIQPVSFSAAERFLTTTLAGQAPIRLMVVESPQLALALLPALTELRRSGQVDLVTFDLTPEIGAAIAAGEVAFAIDQQPWLQGYLSVLQIVLTRRVGVAGMLVDTGAQVVGKLEYEFLAPLIARGIR